VVGFNPVLDLPLSEGSGTTVYDRSGRDNHGTIYGATWEKHWRDWMLYFDGDDWVEVPHSTDFDLRELTMALWVKTPPSMGRTWRNIMSKRSSVVFDRDYGFWLHSSDLVTVDGLHQSSHRFGSFLHYLPTPFNPETWHFVGVAIHKDGTQKSYYDGVLLGTYAGTPSYANNPYPIWVGRADNYWNSFIGHAMLFAKALTDEQMSVLASLFRGEKRSPP